MRTLFQLNDKSLHPSCKIYEKIYGDGESYVGETTTNVNVIVWPCVTWYIKSMQTFIWKYPPFLVGKSLDLQCIKKETCRQDMGSIIHLTIKPTPNNQIEPDFASL